MKPPIESLEDLLRALSRERDLRGRMRVLARAWKLLRSLSPAQREQVALRMGSRWAWQRIEKSFLADGELDEGERLVGAAFQRMAEADPREIRKLARRLREGDGQTAKDLLVLTLTEALEEEAGQQEVAHPAPLGPPSDAEPASDAATQTPSQPAAPPEIVDSARAVLASARAQPVQTRPGGSATPAAAATSLPTPAPSTVAEPPAPSPSPAEPAGESPALPAYDGLARLRLLRELQREDRPGGTLDALGRGRLLDALGGGWASRRALSRMIAARSLDDLDEALGHVNRLLRSGQQTWCLADLLESWDLDAEQVERILAAAPSEAARRRLGRRTSDATRATRPTFR